MNAVEIKNVSKTYKDFVLDNINLSLPEGCIMGLIGENGAGKSTTIKIITDSIKADTGNVTVLGTDNQSREFQKIKNDIGVVLDEAYFPLVLNADDVGSIMKDTYINWDMNVYNSYLEKFNLPHKKKFSDFSRGMKMKLSIAVALSHNPRLLILDEATSGLDPMVRDEILDIFNEFTRDSSHSILISSHIISDLEKICDYIAFIHKGRLMLCEEKDRLFEDYAVLKLSNDDFESVPEQAVISKKVTPYGVEALVKDSEVSDVFKREYASLEEIILFLVKGGENK